VQTNVAQSNKTYWTLEQEVRDYRRMQELTQEAAGLAEAPKLIVWPETMMPGISIEPKAIEELAAKELVFTLKEPMPDVLGTNETRVKATAFWEALSALSKTTAAPLLIGEEGLDNFRVSKNAAGEIELQQDARFNSVYLVRDGKVELPRYDKIELTPFGEYMPVISRFAWLEQKLLALAAQGMKFDLAQGTKKTVFEVATGEGTPGMRVVTPICFEVTESALCRSLVFENGTRRADVMVNLSNDGWFGDDDDAREHHLRISRWRCLELGTPMIRAANTGISAVIDANGRVRARGVASNQAGHRVDGVLSAMVPLPQRESVTLYARTGNVVGWASFAGWLVVTLAAMWQSRRLIAVQ
jgi:apolipoprotein N-acyltransferase